MLDGCTIYRLLLVLTQRDVLYRKKAVVYVRHTEQTAIPQYRPNLQPPNTIQHKWNTISRAKISHNTLFETHKTYKMLWLVQSAVRDHGTRQCTGTCFYLKENPVFLRWIIGRCHDALPCGYAIYHQAKKKKPRRPASSARSSGTGTNMTWWIRPQYSR